MHKGMLHHAAFVAICPPISSSLGLFGNRPLFNWVLGHRIVSLMSQVLRIYLSIIHELGSSLL